MMEKPVVGQKVRFNNHGIWQVFGRTMGLGPMRNLVMTITWVQDWSMTDGCGTWPVEVDDPEITIFMLDNHCFDEVSQ